MHCSTEHIQHNAGSALLAPSSDCCSCLRSDTAWAKAFCTPAPNTGWILHAALFSSWLVHVWVVSLLSFEVNIQTGGHNGSWPQPLLPSCPRMSSMTKTFHVLLARIGGEAGEGVWRDTGMFVSPLSMAWVAASPPIQLWIAHLESAT